MSLRIALCGASGTGKSTLAAYVSATYDLPFCPVGSRSVAAAMGFASPYDVDAAGRRGEFQKRLLSEKKEWEEAHDSFVTDRTHLDNLVYSMLHCVDQITDEFYVSVLVGMERYTHVLHLPVDAFCRPDGDPARRQDPVYHHLYDAALSGLLAQGQISSARSVGFVPVADLDERKRYLDGVISASGWASSQVRLQEDMARGFAYAALFEQAVELGRQASIVAKAADVATSELNETERRILRKRGVLR